jgi:hypothetical protein
MEAPSSVAAASIPVPVPEYPSESAGPSVAGVLFQVPTVPPPAQGACPNQADELDVLVQKAHQLYNSCTTWEQLVTLLHGTKGDFHEDVSKIPHQATDLLARFHISGAPVTLSTSPWSQERKLDALLWGPHQSTYQNIPFLGQEFVDIIHKGQWILLPASLVLSDLNLHLSHLGIVLRRDWLPITHSDCTVCFINEDMVAVARGGGGCMQSGIDLWRVLKQVKHVNPKMRSIYLSKIDIADIFYLIWTRAVDMPHLGFLLTSRTGDEPLEGFSLVLQMGWK